MNYGAIMGMILVALTIVLDQLGVDTMNAKWLNIINYLVFIGFIIYGTYQYREASEGFISYPQALKLGTSIVFFSSLILAFYIFVYANFINPDLIEEILLKSEEQIWVQNPNISDEEMEVALSMVEKFTTPTMMSVMTILSQSFMGFIFSLLTSLFLRNNKPEFEA